MTVAHKGIDWPEVTLTHLISPALSYMTHHRCELTEAGASSIKIHFPLKRINNHVRIAIGLHMHI